MSRTPAPAAIVSDGTLEGFIRRYCIVEKYDGMRASVQDAAKSRVVVDSGPPYKPINDDPLPLQQLVAVHKVVCTDPAKRQGTLDMLGYGVVAVLLERLFRHPQRSGAAVKDKFPGVPVEIASLRRIAPTDVRQWLAKVLGRRESDASLVRLATQLHGGTLALLFSCSGASQDRARRLLTIAVDGDTEPQIIDALSRAIGTRQYPAQRS